MEKLSEFDRQVLSIIQSSINDTIKNRMCDYNSPLKPLIDDAFKIHAESVR